MTDRPRTVALIVAAGSGSRAGGAVPKQYAMVAGKPLIAHAYAAFAGHSAVDEVVVVIAAGAEHFAAAALGSARTVTGGPSRRESVALGLAAIVADRVLVHDAARPCVTDRLITRAIQSARRHRAVACGLPAALTIKAVDDRQRVRLTLDREQLWCMQTPQVFSRSWFAQALARLDGRPLEPCPDDATVLEAAGFPVQVVPGDPLNIKVTTREDLMLAEAILKSRGQGSGDRSQWTGGRT